MPRPRTDVALSLPLAKKRRQETARLLKAAEAAEAWSAISALVLQLRQADLAVALAERVAREAAEAKGGKGLSPTEAAAALVEMTLKAPIKVQWEIYRRLSEANPNWKEDI